MKLYMMPGACSQAPHIALHELGLQAETVKVNLATHTLPDGSDYRAVNPKGYVPFLVLDDGSTLSETQVILQYLAEQRPGVLAPAFGTRARWDVVQWLGYVATEMHKGFSPLFNPATTGDLRERTVQALGDRFSLISETLGKQPFLTGDNFTIADIYLFVVLNWTGYAKIDLAPWPALTEFQARVAARPAVQATLRAEGFIK